MIKKCIFYITFRGKIYEHYIFILDIENMYECIEIQTLSEDEMGFQRIILT